jgi:HNH endonuclease
MGMPVPLSQFLDDVQQDRQAEIHAYLKTMKQLTANQHLEAIGEYYGFKTFWDPTAFDGWRVMLGQDLADVMYETRDVMALGQLLRRYRIDLMGIRASKYNTLTLKAHFGLAKTVSQVSFATWKHFLIAGMKGQTEPARKVCAYLLRQEEQARIAAILQQDPITLLRASILQVDTKQEEGFRQVHTQLRVIEGGLSEAKADLSETKALAITAHTNSLRVERELNDYKVQRQQRAKHAIPAWIYKFYLAVSHGHCMRCDKMCRWDVEPEHPDYANVDHIKRLAEGERADVTRCQLLCVECHQYKTGCENHGVGWWMLDFRSGDIQYQAQCLKDQRYKHRRKQLHQDQLHFLRLFMQDDLDAGA